MKAAILILSDPKSGTEEANGRLFNALAAAHDLIQRKHDVTIIFQGTGTRWAALLARKDHPFHGLFESVRGAVAGVSCACSEVFGAREEAEASGAALLTDNPLPGTSGLPSTGGLLEAGYQILTF
jgi:hypothetical protein